MEQEATIVTETVWKPYKLIGVFLILIGLCFFIMVLASTYWIHSESGFRQGLWKECYNDSRVVRTMDLVATVKPNQKVSCYKAVSQGWLSACQALAIISFLMMVIAAVSVVLSWFMGDKVKRRLTFIGGICVLFAAVIMFFPLVIFPVCIVKSETYANRTQWELSWGYGLSWGVLFFQVASGLLFIIAPETKQVYFSERYE